MQPHCLTVRLAAMQEKAGSRTKRSLSGVRPFGTMLGSSSMHGCFFRGALPSSDALGVGLTGRLFAFDFCNIPASSNSPACPSLLPAATIAAAVAAPILLLW
jgi:hypothetical protein